MPLNCNLKKNTDLRVCKRRKRFPYKQGERVKVPHGAGNFVKYTKDGKIVVEQFGGYNFNFKQKQVQPFYNINRRIVY